MKLELNVGKSKSLVELAQGKSENFSQYKLQLFPVSNGNGRKHKRNGNNLYRKRLSSIRRLIS